MKLEAATLLLAVLTSAVGLLSITASVAGWNWFFNSASARAITGRMSRRKARILYFIMGIAILIMGIVIGLSTKID